MRAAGRRTLRGTDRWLFAGGVAALAASAASEYSGAPKVATFGLSAVAIAVLAAVVGRSVDELADRMGPGLTGFTQSALGNLPELFVGIFALRAGLVGVLQAALVGSILANVVLVLGVAFVAGGWRNGAQRFSTDAPRLTLMLLVLAVAIVSLPTLTSHLGTRAASHEVDLSDVASVILLIVFVLSIPATIRQQRESPEAHRSSLGTGWSAPFALVVLALASVGSLAVSDWFIAALTPAMASLHISPSFAGLVIVAIASSAVENYVGVRLAYQNRPDYSLSVILQSPVQIAIGLIPVLVLLSNGFGPHHLTLVFPTLLFSVLVLAVVIAIVIVLDGESTWLEGAALVGLYATIATAYWWGS